MIPLTKLCWLNSMPNLFTLLADDKSEALPKVKALADANFYVAQKVLIFFDRVENIVGKAENAGHQHLILSQLFSKVFFPWVINPFPNKNLLFSCLHYNSFQNPVEKVEIAPFPTHFLHFWRNF